MAYMVVFNGHGKKRNKHIRAVREYSTKRGRYCQNSYANFWFEFLASIFIFLVVMAILSGIACLLN